MDLSGPLLLTAALVPPPHAERAIVIASADASAAAFNIRFGIIASLFLIGLVSRALERL